MRWIAVMVVYAMDCQQWLCMRWRQIQSYQVDIGALPMKPIPLLFHLTIHKIAFHIKFPAALSIDLHFDQVSSNIASHLKITSESIKMNKLITHQTVIPYSLVNRQYQSKKISIILTIKTKNSENKLTAGIVSILFNHETKPLQNKFEKFTRCSDANAFIQYSFQVKNYEHPITLEPSTTHKSPSVKDDNRKSRNKFISAAKYQSNNAQHKYQSNNAQHKYQSNNAENIQTTSFSNELQDYIQPNNSKLKRHKSTAKDLQQGRMLDDSKTEKVFYNNKQRQSKASKESHRQELEHRKYSNNMHKYEEINFYKEENEILRIENKEEKERGKRVEEQGKRMQEQAHRRQVELKNLSKKLELREENYQMEIKLLKNKLEGNQMYIKELLFEKNNMINQKEAHLKELAKNMASKETRLKEQMGILQEQLRVSQTQYGLIQSRLETYYSLMLTSQKSLEAAILQNKELQHKAKALQDKQKIFAAQTLSNKEVRQTLMEQMLLSHELKANVKQTIASLKQLKQEKDKQFSSLKLSEEHLQEDIKQVKQGLLSKIHKKNENMLQLNVQMESLKKQISGLRRGQGEMNKRMRDKQMECARMNEDAGRMLLRNKQLQRQVEKSQMYYANFSERNERENFIEMGRLNEKIHRLQVQNMELTEKCQQLKFNLRLKEEEGYEFTTKIIQNETQLLETQRHNEELHENVAYLEKLLSALEEKEEKLAKLEEKYEYNERRLFQIEQNNQIHQIQHGHEIKHLESKTTEHEEQIRYLKGEIQKMHKERAALYEQVSDLKIELNNRSNELEHLKQENSALRTTDISFAQKIITLKSNEESSVSSYEQVSFQNGQLRKKIKENEEVIRSVGKKLQQLNKSILECLLQALEVMQMKSSKNRRVKHEKAQIAGLINNMIELIFQERQQTSKELQNAMKRVQQCEIMLSEHIKQLKNKERVELQYANQLIKQKYKLEIGQIRLLELQNELTRANKHNEDTSHSNQQLSQQLQLALDKLQTIAKMKDEEIKIIICTNQGLKKQLDTLKQGWQNQKEQLMRAENERVVRVEQQLKQSASNLQCLKGEIKQKKQIISQQRVKVSRLQHQVKVLSSQKQGLLKLKQKKEEAISQLNKTLKENREAILSTGQALLQSQNRQENARRQWERQRQQAKTQQKGLQRQMGQLKNKLEIKQSEAKQLRKEVLKRQKEQKGRMQQLNSEISSLTGQLRALDQDNQTLIKAFAEKEEKYELTISHLAPNKEAVDAVISQIQQMKNISNNYELSKNKLVKMAKNNISDALLKFNHSNIIDIIRDISIEINRFKIVILTKLSLPQKHKILALDKIKDLQTMLLKINRVFTP